MTKRRRLSRFVFLISLPVTVSALLLLVSYASLPIWAPALMRTVLADHDVELLELEVNRPGWKTLRITRAALNYDVADHTVMFGGTDITLTYSWRQLLEGRLDALQVSSASVQLIPIAQNNNVKDEPLSVPLLLPEELFSQLPLDQARVDSFELVLPETSSYQLLNGDLNYTDGELTLNLDSLEIPANGLPKLALIFKLDQQNTVALSLRQGVESVVDLHSQIIRDDVSDAAQVTTQLQGDLVLNLEAGAELLKQLGMIESHYQINGDAQLHWQGAVPEIIDEVALQQLLLTGEFSSHGSVMDQQAAFQKSPAQFVINAHFEFMDEAIAVSFSEFNVSGLLDLSSELAPWLSAGLVKALPVAITLTPNAQLYVRLDSTALQLIALQLKEGSAELAIGQRNASVFAELALQALNLELHDGWRGAGKFKTQLTAKQIKNSEITAESLAFSTAGSVSWEPDVTRVQFDAGAVLQGRRLKVQKGEVVSVNARIPHAFQTILQGKNLTLPALECQLGETPLHWDGKTYGFTAAALRLKDLWLDWEKIPQMKAHIHSRVTDVQFPVEDLQLKPLDFQGDWRLTEKKLKGSFELKDAAELIVVNGQLQHNLDSGRGSLRSQLDEVTFLQNKPYLPALFNAWPYPFDLFAGQLKMNSVLNWDASQVFVNGRLKLHDVGGFYDTNLFRGLNTELFIDGLLTDLKVVVEQFQLDNLDVGTPVKNVNFSLQATPSGLKVQDLQAELLGGRVGQKRIHYDWTQDENELLLQLQGIQLRDVLQLELGIEGYGTLDGQLPIKITQNGISVTLGKVQAKPPGGVIKYQGGESMNVAAANIGVGFALDALRNFHYDALDVTVDYAEDGQLQLGAALLGRNPDMTEQRPVNFNINIQENIPALVKSLKLTQDISDDIERRLQTFYE